MIKKVLITLFSIGVILVLVGLCCSQEYAVERSIVIRAPGEKIFPLFGDLEHWPKWDPFAEQDPTAKITLSEKTTGVGASRSWEGERDKGKLTFTTWDPKSGIVYDLVFTNGAHDSPATSSMLMDAHSDGSVAVRWSMQGKLNMPVIGAYFAMFADRWIGPHFERGLARLKDKAEEQSPPVK